MAIIQASDLSYTYPSYHPEAAPVKTLKDVNLEIAKGEVFALMGPTGAGKTTLCLTLSGIIPHLVGGEMTGSVMVAGNDIHSTPPAALAGIVGMVYQDPESQLFCATVEEEVAFGLENLGVAGTEIDARIEWALQVSGLPDSRRLSPAILSGGQKQRVAIACSLAMLPEILILDEPASSLDPAGQADVMAAIARLRQERQMTLLLVTSDAEQVIHMADSLAFLVEGEIIAQGVPQDLLGDRQLVERAGIAPPQSMGLAWEFNRRHQSAYRWFTVEQAETALRARLADAG